MQFQYMKIVKSISFLSCLCLITCVNGMDKKKLIKNFHTLPLGQRNPFDVYRPSFKEISEIKEIKKGEKNNDLENSEKEKYDKRALDEMELRLKKKIEEKKDINMWRSRPKNEFNK